MSRIRKQLDPNGPVPAHVPALGQCVVWTGLRDGNGYGRIKWLGKAVSVHRVIWLDANGPIPEELEVCHRCDNPPCGRLDHLFLGTHQQNVHDSVLKGRARRAQGEAHGRSKLTDDLVRTARLRHASGESGKALAQEYGVAQPVMARVLAGKAWKHVQ